MMHQQFRSGGATALPLALLAQAIPMLSRHEPESLTERLIDHLDHIDGDPDLEDNNDREDIDEREPENDCASGDWLIDQRFAFATGCNPVNTDDFPPR